MIYPFKFLPQVVKNLIILNIIFFVATIFFQYALKYDLNQILSLHFFKSSNFGSWQLVTSMFMHVNVIHLASNMFALFILGPSLETLWGSKKFLLYYLITGIGASLMLELSWVWDLREILSNSAIKIDIGDAVLSQKEFFKNYPIGLGASGAVFGILLAFGIKFPNEKLGIFPLPFLIKAKWFVIIYGLIELFLGVANFKGDNVAHFAHLGGMIFGIFLILYWRKKGNSNHHNYSQY